MSNVLLMILIAVIDKGFIASLMYLLVGAVILSTIFETINQNKLKKNK